MDSQYTIEETIELNQLELDSYSKANFADPNIVKLLESINYYLRAAKFEEPAKIEEDPNREVVCGYLKEGAIVSQKGYKTARAGRLVYETRDKYVVYLQSEVEGKPQARMTFYKETLDNLIDFDR